MLKLTDEEKSQKAFQEFTDQFGENDLIKEAFFDILLEAIYGEETTNCVSVSSEARQDRNKDNECPGAWTMPCYEIE